MLVKKLFCCMKLSHEESDGLLTTCLKYRKFGDIWFFMEFPFQTFFSEIVVWVTRHHWSKHWHQRFFQFKFNNYLTCLFFLPNLPNASNFSAGLMTFQSIIINLKFLINFDKVYLHIWYIVTFVSGFLCVDWAVDDISTLPAISSI